MIMKCIYPVTDAIEQCTVVRATFLSELGVSQDVDRTPTSFYDEQFVLKKTLQLKPAVKVGSKTTAVCSNSEMAA